MKTESGVGGQMGIFWGHSKESYDAAVKVAAQVAQEELSGKTLQWLKVEELRGRFDDGTFEYQVVVHVGYSS